MRRRSRASSPFVAVAAALGGALFALASCSEPDAPIARAVSADGEKFGTSECAACVDLACVDDVDDCTADPECGAYLQCVRDCPIDAKGSVDENCRKACPQAQDTAGIAAITAFETCRTTGLGGNCGRCGNAPNVKGQTCKPAPSSNPCFQCEDEKCCDVEAACDADPDCLPYKVCLVACYNLPDSEFAGCQAECLDAHPGGLLRLPPLLACVNNICLVECGKSAPNACTICQQQGACQEQTLLVDVDPFGNLLEACLINATDAITSAGCRTAYPTATGLVDDLTKCVETKCPCG